MKIPFLLCATLALPAICFAAPKHSPDDGHAHAAPKPNEGSFSDYLWRKSDDAFHAGDYPRAISLHRAIVQVDPSDVESYGVGAWLLWSLGKADEADAFIAQGLKANPDDPEMWSAAGEQYDLEKRRAEAQKAYGKAVELAGKDADQMLRRRYAHASEGAGDLKTSAQVWRDLVKDFPNDAVNKNNLARVEEQLAAQTKTAAAPAVGLMTLGALMVVGVPLVGWRNR